MLTYMIVVNDNGELKAVDQFELQSHTELSVQEAIEQALNRVLDLRSETLEAEIAEEEEYEASKYLEDE